MQKIVMIVLSSLCSIAFGASPVYVDPNVTVSGPGTSPETAKKTIAEAIDAVSEGGAVKLLPGTYSAHAILIDNPGRAKTMTIQSDSTRVKLLTNTTACVLVSHNAVNKTITIKNIEFSVENSGDSFVHFNVDCEGAVVLEDCVFTQNPAANKPLCLRFGNSSIKGYSRYVTFRRCTYSSNAANAVTGGAINVGPCSRFLVDNCDLNFEVNANQNSCFYVNGEINEFSIINSRINCKSCLVRTGSNNPNNFILRANTVIHSANAGTNEENLIWFWQLAPMDNIQIEDNTLRHTVRTGTLPINMVAVSKYAAGYQIKNVKVHHNVITTDLPGYVGAAILLSRTADKAVITQNTITGFDVAISSEAPCVVVDNDFEGASPLVFSCSSNVIANNRVVAMNGIIEGRALLFQRTRITSPSSASTTFTATTVRDTSTWPLIDVTPRMICIVKPPQPPYGPDSYLMSHWGYVKSAGANTVEVEKWTSVATGLTETPPHGSYAQVVVFATNNTVVNNVFDAHQANFGINFDFMPMDGMNYIDYNSYIKGITSFSNLGYAVKGWGVTNSLVAQRARWLVFSPSYPLNDAHSTQLDPGTKQVMEFDDTTVWPMHAGEVWQYTAYPVDGSAAWIYSKRIGEQVQLDGKWYYPYGDSYFRSTTDKIYEWEPGGETLFFQTASIGTTWNHSTNNTVEIMDDHFALNDVYGGPYSAYKLKFTDPGGTWYSYVVPGMGIVQWDELDADVPHILKLTGIRTSAQDPLLLWPLSIGRAWTYRCRDAIGNEWTETRQVLDKTVANANTYYRVRFTEQGEQFDVRVRSTANALFILDEQGNETMDFVLGPEGFTSIPDPNRTRELTAIESINVPYGGPYQAYSFSKTASNEPNLPSPYMVESVVPGLGFVKIVDYWVQNPPVTKELISIQPDHLCGDLNYPYPEGDADHDCIVNFSDFLTIAQNWLTCTTGSPGGPL